MLSTIDLFLTYRTDSTDSLPIYRFHSGRVEILDAGRVPVSKSATDTGRVAEMVNRTRLFLVPIESPQMRLASSH